MTSDQSAKPAAGPKDGKGRQDAPDSGEIEWAGGFIANPPAPSEVRVDPEKARKPDE